MLSKKEAERELLIAEKLNPGPWVSHSRSVGLNAKLIADKIDKLDSNYAYAMGLLHDIGRRKGVTSILHTIDGYDYMMSLNQKEIAKICLTHSYPIQDVNTFFGKFDCTEEQKDFLELFIKDTIYDDYDRLIQLCDAISLPNGACIMEKRLIDVSLRHGLPDFTINKWKAFLELKKHFDKLCGCNIYTLLPNVMENSYESLL
ncbi:HD domain-containing protein [Clostridium sp. BJN0001]|uniref:HD domain-containing protein n=1 Tax=Clostridium sp. BJN0001 TaxID=2930219 RepID=UPI001FD1F17C|nr:HD domain-containing protein [Clostridium sp. BJN0001]